MTQNGDPLENAIAERVNWILKDEFELERFSCDLASLQRIVRQSIVIYNELRQHFSCSLLTPVKMHEQNELQRAIYHKKIRSKQTLTPDNFNIAIR